LQTDPARRARIHQCARIGTKNLIDTSVAEQIVGAA
jgi:hypothetical protein